MRVVSVVVALVLFAFPAVAAPKPPGYDPAEQFFNSSLNLRDRIYAQTLLIAAGFQSYVPTPQFQANTFDGTRRFQSENSLPATGRLDTQTVDRLASAAAPQFQQWGFREIAHPYRGHPIWMPQSMDLRPIPNKWGLTFRDPDERLEIHYNFFPNKYIDKEYYDTLANLRSKGTYVQFSTQKDDWYVISSSSPAGIDAYRRYHIDGTGVLGFTVFWNNARGVVNGERIATLMSGSLGAAMGDRPFLRPGDFSAGPTPTPAPQPYSPPSPSPSPPTVSCGPGDKLNVRGVPPNDVLMIRELPDQGSRVIDTVPPDGTNIDCQGDQKGAYTFIRFGRSEGWALSRYLEAMTRRGRRLEEDEH